MRIDEFISDRKTFIIPVYQRNYDWLKANCKQLFDDVEFIAKNGGEHFIGTFVYKREPSASTFQEFVIIDGQQRITSIILFTKALHDLTDDEDLKDSIREKFIKHHNGTLKGKCKLRPTEYDRITFEKLMRDEFFDENNFSEQEKSSALYVNYRFFHEKVSASEKSLQDLHEAICRLRIVSISLESEKPQEIFESLNSTGLNLAKADLIRNFLLMQVVETRVQKDLYENYWLELENLLRPSDNVENFLVQYLIAKLKTNDAYAMKASSDTLYVLFKKFFAKECFDVESCLKDLLRYAKYFHHLLFNDDTKFEKLSPLYKKFYELVYLLNAKKSPIILMYLIDRNEKGIFDETMFINFVDALISLTFRAKVCKRNGITQQFAGNVLARLDKEKTLDKEKFWRALLDSSRVIFPNDKDFQSSLINNNLYETIGSDGCKYLLYSMERSVRAKELPAYSEATVEHILPKKLSETWKNYLKEHNDSQTHELWLHTLGNLTLTAYNSELGNSDFEKKKKIYSESHFSYTRALTNYDEWTSTQIQKRAKKLADAAIKIWMLPEEFNSNIVNRGDTFNLDSDFGQFIKIKPAILFISNTEIKISSWKSLLCEVVKQLYNLDRGIFHRVINVKKNLFMTESKNNGDFKLEEDLYMKTQKNVEQLLRITKTIVENFDRFADTNFKAEISFTLRK